jgi:Trk K+ transport system NAD-binding subunit
MFNPAADTTIEAGDYLIVMGRMENLRALEGLMAEPHGTRSTRLL